MIKSLPPVCQVLECGEEIVLTLTEVERIKALAAQLVKLLRAQKNSSIAVSLLLSEYSKTFGYGLRLQDYDASSLPALLAKLCHVVKVQRPRPWRHQGPGPELWDPYRRSLSLSLPRWWTAPTAGKCS